MVPDSYNDISIKTGCRDSRGSGSHYLLKSPDQLIPYDVIDFLSVGQNKEVLFGLVRRSIEESPPQGRIVYFCERQCTRITPNGSETVDCLASDHEEADTKLIAYAYVASAFSSGILVRSPSGDVDIAILLVCHHFRGCKMYLDNGTSKNRCLYDLNDFSMPEKTRLALLGNHGLGGNDYVSCFFRKGKKTCWKTCLKSDLFIDSFSELGSTLQVSEELENAIGKYVCHLYGQKQAKKTRTTQDATYFGIAITRKEK